MRLIAVGIYTSNRRARYHSPEASGNKTLRTERCSFAGGFCSHDLAEISSLSGNHPPIRVKGFVKGSSDNTIATMIVTIQRSSETYAERTINDRRDRSLRDKSTLSLSLSLSSLTRGAGNPRHGESMRLFLVEFPSAGQLTNYFFFHPDVWNPPGGTAPHRGNALFLSRALLPARMTLTNVRRRRRNYQTRRFSPAEKETDSQGPPDVSARRAIFDIISRCRVRAALRDASQSIIIISAGRREGGRGARRDITAVAASGIERDRRGKRLIARNSRGCCS